MKSQISEYYQLNITDLVLIIRGAYKGRRARVVGFYSSTKQITISLLPSKLWLLVPIFGWIHYLDEQYGSPWSFKEIVIEPSYVRKIQ